MKKVRVSNRIGYLWVKCGHCPACLQEKANRRARRIKKTQVYDDNVNPLYDVLFCSFTYDNKYIPYIRISDVEKFMTDLRGTIPVYRDYDRKKVKVSLDSADYKDIRVCRPIAEYALEDMVDCRGCFDHLDDITFQPLRKWIDRDHWTWYDTDKVAVCYYKDIQNFFKRVKIYADRHNITDRIFTYQCSEYGETTARAHFHVVAFVPKGHFELWKDIFAKAWPYDSRVSDRIGYDYGSSRYVAAYVNSPASVASFLSVSPCFKAKHSYSQGFGRGDKRYSLARILEDWRKVDFEENVRHFTKHGFLDTRAPIPEYVIRGYFPKFKAYCRLTRDEIDRVCSNPRQFAYYFPNASVSMLELRDLLQKIYDGVIDRTTWNNFHPLLGPNFLDYDHEDIYKTIVMLRNLHKKYTGVNKLSLDFYSSVYSTIWSKYLSAVERVASSDYDFGKVDDVLDYYQNTDIGDFLFLRSAHYIKSLRYLNRSKYTPNDSERNKQRTAELTEQYFEMSKDKKVKQTCSSAYYLGF